MYGCVRQLRFDNKYKMKKKNIYQGDEIKKKRYYNYDNEWMNERKVQKV